MHSKILAVLGLWITSVILQAADARAPVGMAPRRHLGSYKEYPHEHDKNHSHHRRRLQGRSIKATGHQNDGNSSGKGYSYVYYPQLLLASAASAACVVLMVVKRSLRMCPRTLPTPNQKKKENETELNKPKSAKEAMSNATYKST
ncbi:hypothetical protein JG687_00018834, partial [Phytophthora cactorum]